MGGVRLEIAILSTTLRRICLMESEMEMSNRSYGPWLAGDTAGRRLQQATKEGEAQREGVKGEGGAGGNNLESSFPTLTAKIAGTERQTKYSWWTQNVRASGGTASYIGQALRSTASRCQKCGNGGVPFLDCNLLFGDDRYMERVGSPFSGCVKSETGKKGQAPK
jgi:hypothetical protein